MENIKKERKPGRSVFFEDQDADGQSREDHIPESGNNVINLSADAEAQLRSLLVALKAVKKGDFSVRLPMGKNGAMAEIAEAFNDVIVLNESMAGQACMSR